jgi:hypothetical protein
MQRDRRWWVDDRPAFASAKTPLGGELLFVWLRFLYVPAIVFGIFEECIHPILPIAAPTGKEIRQNYAE